MAYEQTIEQVRSEARALRARARAGEVPQALADAYDRCMAKRSDAR